MVCLGGSSTEDLRFLAPKAIHVWFSGPESLNLGYLDPLVWIIYQPTANDWEIRLAGFGTCKKKPSAEKTSELPSVLAVKPKDMDAM